MSAAAASSWSLSSSAISVGFTGSIELRRSRAEEYFLVDNAEGCFSLQDLFKATNGSLLDVLSDNEHENVKSKIEAARDKLAKEYNCSKLEVFFINPKVTGFEYDTGVANRPGFITNEIEFQQAVEDVDTRKVTFQLTAIIEAPFEMTKTNIEDNWRKDWPTNRSVLVVVVCACPERQCSVFFCGSKDSAGGAAESLNKSARGCRNSHSRTCKWMRENSQPARSTGKRKRPCAPSQYVEGADDSNAASSQTESAKKRLSVQPSASNSFASLSGIASHINSSETRIELKQPERAATASSSRAMSSSSHGMTSQQTFNFDPHQWFKEEMFRLIQRSGRSAQLVMNSKLSGSIFQLCQSYLAREEVQRLMVKESTSPLSVYLPCLICTTVRFQGIEVEVIAELVYAACPQFLPNDGHQTDTGSHYEVYYYTLGHEDIDSRKKLDLTTWYRSPFIYMIRKVGRVCLQEFVGKFFSSFQGFFAAVFRKARASAQIQSLFAAVDGFDQWKVLDVKRSGASLTMRQVLTTGKFGNDFDQHLRLDLTWPEIHYHDNDITPYNLYLQEYERGNSPEIKEHNERAYQKYLSSRELASNEYIEDYIDETGVKRQRRCSQVEFPYRFSLVNVLLANCVLECNDIECAATCDYGTWQCDHGIIHTDWACAVPFTNNSEAEIVVDNLSHLRKLQNKLNSNANKKQHQPRRTNCEDTPEEIRRQIGSILRVCQPNPHGQSPYANRIMFRRDAVKLKYNDNSNEKHKDKDHQDSLLSYPKDEYQLEVCRSWKWKEALVNILSSFREHVDSIHYGGMWEQFEKHNVLSRCSLLASQLAQFSWRYPQDLMNPSNTTWPLGYDAKHFWQWNRSSSNPQPNDLRLIRFQVPLRPGEDASSCTRPHFYLPVRNQVLEELLGKNRIEAEPPASSTESASSEVRIQTPTPVLSGQNAQSSTAIEVEEERVAEVHDGAQPMEMDPPEVGLSSVSLTSVEAQAPVAVASAYNTEQVRASAASLPTENHARPSNLSN